MRRNYLKGLSMLLFYGIVATIVYIGLQFLVPKAPNLLMHDTQGTAAEGSGKTLKFVAIGDSLTEGVGDTTASGGFVPIAAKELKEDFDLSVVQTDNYGVAGERSDQILKRLKKDTELRKSLQTADVITLTCGGNDLMKTVRSEIFNDLTVESFNTPMKDYQKNLTAIYTEIRKEAPSAPIYLFGIYNPFYVYFSEIKEMQTIVDNWNQVSLKVTNNEKKSHFIPINDLLYNGTNSSAALETSDSSTASSNNQTASSKEINDLLYEDDHFHPNHLGYQIMASALVKEMTTTKSAWLADLD